MRSYADPKKDGKSKAKARRQDDRKPALRSTDNRPEAIVQQKLQETINNSPRAMQLKAIQEMANNSPKAQQAAQLQAMAQQHAASRFQEKKTRKQNLFKRKQTKPACPTI